jgi:hypothetical protein
MGDRVVTTRNRRGLSVVNGSRGTVEDIDEHQRTVTVHLDATRSDEAGRVTTLPAEYLDGGHLSHAYAITGHKAQGMTAERAFVLGDEAMYREWGYVALSRGRAENSLYVVVAELEPTDDTCHRRVPADSSDQVGLRIAENALMASREHRLALDHFEAVAGPLPSAGPAPALQAPPKELDDAALRAAAAAATETLTHAERPDLAEPGLVDPGRTVAELSERHRYLTERRAVLDAEMESTRARLAATEGPVARRRYRQERDWLQCDLSVGARKISEIDRQLPALETRLETIRNDQVATDGWYQRRADAARRCYALNDEASARIDRRVQAAASAPLIAGHCAPPLELSARWEWWSSASELERARLWASAGPKRRVTAAQPDRRTEKRDGVAPGMERRADVAEVLGRLEVAETAAQRRRERPPRQASTLDRRYGHDYLSLQQRQQQLAEQEHITRSPRLSP